MNDMRKVGRVTIPTDLDVVPETLEIMKRWGADAIRDCDGTDFPAELQMAVNAFGNGRSVYISGLPYSFENSRVLYRAILWAAHGEEILNKWFSTHYNVEVHAFVANNTYVPQDTTVYTDKGSFDLHLEANEIRWYNL